MFCFAKRLLNLLNASDAAPVENKYKIIDFLMQCCQTKAMVTEQGPCGVQRRDRIGYTGRKN